MAEQDPLDYTSQRFEKIKKEALDAIRGTGDLQEGWKKAQDAAEDYYVQMKQQKALTKQLGREYEQVFKKAEKRANAFTKPFEKFADLLQTFPIDQLFDSNKIDSAISTFKQEVMTTFEGTGGGFGESIASGLKESLMQTQGVASAVAGLAGKIGKAFSPAGAAVLGVGILAAGVYKLYDAFKQVDEATAGLIQKTGVLDDTLSTTLIEATESSSLLGGNLQFAAEAVEELFNQFSVSIPISSVLVGNVARLSEQFGIGVENATALTRIISQRVTSSLGESSSLASQFIDSLGRIGPAVVRNIVENYDEVNNAFGLTISELRTQGLLATQLGVSLGNVTSNARGLLDLTSSISSEFRASALLGEQLNLQRARQLAFEGDIIGANNEILDQVERLGDLSRLNTFQREALADATGKTVSELERELNIRRRIGEQGRIQQRTRETALGRIEQLTRAISSQFFRVFASPEVQQSFNGLIESIQQFVTGDTMNSLINTLSNLIDKLGSLARGEARINPWALIGRGDFIRNTDGRQLSMDDGIITSRGDVVSTNPRDYIIATQTPGDLVGGTDSETKQIMSEVRGLLKHLKDNGVKAGDTYLDGRKVSKQLASSIR